MALGLILLPAVAASFWAREVWSMTLVAAPMAFASALIRLLVSFHVGLPSGPVIVLFASPSWARSCSAHALRCARGYRIRCIFAADHALTGRDG